MIPKRIFRTYTFRFTVLYVLLISVLSSLISVLVYRTAADNYAARVEQSIADELRYAVSHFEQGGIAAFEQYVNGRTLPEIGNRYFFVLARGAGPQEVVAGNLDHWPMFTETVNSDSRPAFGLLDWGYQPQGYFVGKSMVVGDDYHLLVARHYEEVNPRVELAMSILLQSMLVTITLGVIGGAFISAAMIRRIDSLNHSIRTIMQGNLSERLPMSTSGGEIDQLAGQLNIMLERIESSMNDVRQVSDNIAHDLRTPLTRLRNKLAMLEKRSSPQNRDLVREMLVEADHLLSICAALMRIAQVESGAKKADFTDVDLARIFTDVVELYEPLASVKDIALSLERSDPVHIQGDKDLLFQMLANLMDNAIKYTPSGGAITTGLYVGERELRMVFADNGLGVPPAKYGKVFQRFYRVEDSRGIQPGNGLGLSLVQAVAVLHGGRVSLSDSRAYFPASDTPGLTVTVHLPLAGAA